MSEYDPQAIEEKWQSRWAEEGTYQPDPEPDAGPGGDSEADDEADAADGGEKTFITVPYPYPSGGMHVGHARTYTVPDVWARYRRLQGDNVLFPLAWHVTGTPIVGAVERLKSGEEDQLETLKNTYNVPEAELKDLETPMGFARYFIEQAESSYKNGMQGLGLSIDWRREFTTNDERYSKFITWQYETLRERGLLEKGLHPVKFCTNERQPVTTHDLLEGEEAEFQEYTLINFELELGGAAPGEPAETVIAPMATLRPETVRGVTNAYVHPAGTYVRATVDGEPWLVSEEAVEKLELQARDVTVEREIRGADLVGSRVRNPVTGDEVLVLPATFVDTDNATGVVMSVPAHSPDDYVALQDVKRDEERLRSYGVDPDEVRAIEPVPILSIEGYGEVPARDAVERAGIESQDDPELKAVTQELYNREFHQGVLSDLYEDGFAGEVVEDVRDDLGDAYRERGAFGQMYEFSEEVVCRCGGDVEVAKQDTWFLRYNDAEWKRKAHDAVAGMRCIPETAGEQLDHTIDWLNEWPCIRNYGLGTRLPWDDDFVIEPLSDSTIYMAYYTIAHRIQDVPVNDLDRGFFDALFFGPDAVDDPEEVDERALELREEWNYWYPVDFRCSANDLVSNHLTFYVMHHAELFDRPNWPQGVSVMGMGLLEGRKMSSSKGHVVLPPNAIAEYGADTVRFFLLNSAEPWQDYDWRDDQVATTHDQLARFFDRGVRLAASEASAAADGPAGSDPDERPDLEGIDRWLLAKLQATVREATEAMEGFETRKASQAVFYRFEEHLRWYRRRTDTDRPAARWTLREVMKTRLNLLAPFVPHLANELHERLTGEPATEWPAVDDSFEDPSVEVTESLVERLASDVTDIVDVTGEDPDTIAVYVAADWKRDVYDTVADMAVERDGAPDVGQVMGEVMSDPDLREKGDQVNQLVQDLAEQVRGRDADTLGILQRTDEEAVYRDAAGFFEREFDADVVVQNEVDADPDDDRAASAIPFRPAVHLR